MLVAGVLASGLASVYLGQDANWDLLNYHYYNAYSLLNGRMGFDVVPAQIQTFHNPAMDVPLYWLMNAVPPIVCGFLLGALHGVNLFLIYRIAFSLLAGVSDFRRRALALACAITGYYGAINVFEIGASFHDNITSLFVLAGLAILIRRPSLDSTRRVAAAGLLLGIGAGLKLVVAVYAVAFVGCLVLLDASWKQKLRGLLVCGLGILLGASLSMGFWMIRLWKTFGNPLFPYYNKLFRSPWYDFKNFIDDSYFPHGTIQSLFYPFYFVAQTHPVADTEFSDLRLPVCYALLMLIVFMAFYRSVARKYADPGLPAEPPARVAVDTRFFAAWFVLSYVVWQAKFSIYRYLLPLELLAPTFILVAVRYLFPFERVMIRATLVIFALIVLTMRPMGGWAGRKPWSASFFDVRVPALPGLAGATVIFAEDSPLSYVIPSFPAGTRFVSVRSNFMKPTSRNLLQERVRKTLGRCGGGLYLLSRERSKEPYAASLGKYDLRMEPSSRAKLPTKVDDDLYLVPLARTSPCR